MTLLVLSDDLLFSSRITATAREANAPIKIAKNVAALMENARQDPPRCVIVDLGNPGLNISDLLSQLRGLLPQMPLMVAYGSHVDTDALRAAREAGCNIVWPRSKFAEELSLNLPAWISGHAR